MWGDFLWAGNAGESLLRNPVEWTVVGKCAEKTFAPVLPHETIYFAV